MCIHFAFSSPKKKCLSLQMIGNNIQLVSTREVLLSLKHILVKMMMSSPFHLLYVTLLSWIKLVFFNENKANFSLHDISANYLF